MKPDFLPTCVDDVPVGAAAASNLPRWSRLARAVRPLEVGVIGAAAVLAALALPELAAPAAKVGLTVAQGQAWAQTAFGVLSVLLAVTKAASLVRRRRPKEDQHCGALFNMGGLAAEGNRRLADCRRAGKPLTVAVFDFPDLLEVRAIYGNAVFTRLRTQVVAAVAAMGGRRGVAAQMGPAQFAVVLPCHDRARAMEAITRVLGSPSRIEYDAVDSEIVLVPEFLVETVQAHVASVPSACRGLALEIDRMRELQARRTHLMQRERERHSRSPSSVDGTASARRRSRAQPVPMAHPMPTGYTASA